MVTSIILAIVTAVIIFGGIKIIAKVSVVIVPIMKGAYVLVALIFIVMNVSELLGVFVDALVICSSTAFIILFSGLFISKIWKNTIQIVTNGA